MLTEEGRELLQGQMEKHMGLIDISTDLFRGAVVAEVNEIDPDIDVDTLMDIHEAIQWFIDND